MDPNWVHQDQPHAQEWSLRRPAGTTEFQLCLPAKYLTPDHTCAACVQGLSRSPATRNPLDLTRRFSIRSRRRQLLESGVSHQLTAGTAAGRTFVQYTCAPDVPCRCPEWPAEPFRAAGEFQKSAADCKFIASVAFRSQAESAYRQYRAVRWVLLPEGELWLRPAAMLDCKSCVAKWTRTGTGGGLENPAQQRYNCHQPFLAIMRTDGLAAPKRKKRMLDFASALRRVRDSNPRTR